MEESNNWFRQAQADLQTANNSLKSGDFYASVFWSQQAVEKSFKAIIIKNNGKLIKTHDLVRLGKLTNIPKEFSTKIKELASAYTESRYGIGIDSIPADEFDKEVASRLISFSKEVIEWSKKQI